MGENQIPDMCASAIIHNEWERYETTSKKYEKLFPNEIIWEKMIRKTWVMYNDNNKNKNNKNQFLSTMSKLPYI